MSGRIPVVRKPLSTSKIYPSFRDYLKGHSNSLDFVKLTLPIESIQVASKKPVETKITVREDIAYHFQVRNQTELEIYNPTTTQKVLWTLIAPFVNAYYKLFKGSSFKLKLVDNPKMTEAQMREEITKWFEKTGRKVVWEESLQEPKDKIKK